MSDADISLNHEQTFICMTVYEFPASNLSCCFKLRELRNKDSHVKFNHLPVSK